MHVAFLSLSLSQFLEALKSFTGAKFKHTHVSQAYLAAFLHITTGPS